MDLRCYCQWCRLDDLAREFQRKAIPLARNRGNRGWPQDLAQGRDLHLQVILLNDQVGPNQAEQFLLRYQMTRAFNQRYQYVERAWLHDRRHASCQQPALARLQLKLPKPIAVEGGGFRHRPEGASFDGKADAVYRVTGAIRNRDLHDLFRKT